MTDMTAIARPYAKAAFEFAVEEQKILEWDCFLKNLLLIVSDPVAITFVSDPSTTPQQHEALLLGTLKHLESGKITDSYVNFIALLAKNKRLMAIEKIVSNFQQLRADYEKTLTVDVESYSVLSNEQMKDLSARLSQRLQRDITLKVTIDPNLLGGAIIRAGNLVFDGSVRTQIKNLSNTLAA